jgi:hypothetical protein
MTAAGFDSGTVQNHADLMSGKVCAVPTRATAAADQSAADAAEVMRASDACLRSGNGFPDVRVTAVDHDPENTSVQGLRQGHGLVPHRRICAPRD